MLAHLADVELECAVDGMVVEVELLRNSPTQGRSSISEVQALRGWRRTSR